MQKIECRLVAMDECAEHIWHIQLEPAQPVCFRPGQYLQVIMGEKDKRPFSIANSPTRDGLELQGVRAKSRYSRVRNEPRTAGYGLLNLNASHQWQQLRLDFTLGNLLNKRYDLPTGGSYTAQGRSMSLNGITWGTPVPGMGRHYGLAATLEF